MSVHEAEARRRERVGLEDASVRDDDRQVRAKPLQFRRDVGRLGGLKDLEAEFQRRGLDRRGRDLEPAARGTVGLGHDGEHLRPPREQAQEGNGGLGSPEENRFQHGRLKTILKDSCASAVCLNSRWS